MPIAALVRFAPETGRETARSAFRVIATVSNYHPYCLDFPVSAHLRYNPPDGILPQKIGHWIITMGIFQLPIILLMLLFVFPAFAQTVREGVEAYERSDFAAALRKWHPLAEQGNPIAQAGLGLLYARGQGVPRDYREALKWIRLSVEQEHAFGQNSLADMYRNGHGVRQDYSAAVLFYQLSAEQGYAPAQYNLGFMYENGNGIRRDYKQAYMWYTLAAEQGHEGANQSRMILGLSISVEDRWEALERAQRGRQLKEIEGVPPQSSLVDKAEPKEVATSAQEPRAQERPTTASKVVWRIQIASLDSQKKAEEAWSKLQQANADLLGRLNLNVQAAELSKGTFYRVQAGPLADRAAAVLLCNKLKSRNQDCFVVAP